MSVIVARLIVPPDVDHNEFVTDYPALYERFGELIVSQTGMTDSPFGEGASDSQLAALGFPLPDDYALLLRLTGNEVDPSLITFPPEEISLLTVGQVTAEDGKIAVARTRQGVLLHLTGRGLILGDTVIAAGFGDLIGKYVRGLESGTLRIEKGPDGFTFTANGEYVDREVFATL
ncbi:hypothetical protein [Actinoplanes sp. NPDC049265]|uniref:hypothetical protein n=1 Tax=Actinoplanes sp. NPDC049265 TaxID=3363902 RepID=UPI003721C81B